MAGYVDPPTEPDYITEERKPPNPGSDEARSLGCICPVMDNWRGSDEIGRIRGFAMFADCPLHGFED